MCDSAALERGAFVTEKRIAVFPGSFDPVHNGHFDIVERCRPLFDEVVVAVLNNTDKKPLLAVEQRVEVMEDVLADFEDCRVESFSGLLVHFMGRVGARTIVRGLRAVSDFETEFQMALMNRALDPRMETVFMTPKEEYSYVSSRLVKEVYQLGGELLGLVPGPVHELMLEISRPRRA